MNRGPTTRLTAIAAAALLLGAAHPAAPVDPAIAAWAFPFEPMPQSSAPQSTAAALTLPGSSIRHSEAELGDMQNAVDWYPARHPPLPGAVARGSAPGVAACGFCHLPGGQGRVENASLAGLPRDYIEQQVAAFASGSRRAAMPDWLPTAFMAQTAHQVTPAEVHAAAAYFHGLRYVSHIRVVETATIGAVSAQGFILTVAPGAAREPIGQRIVETPTDLQRFERRDPDVGYAAYVPPGSLTRGAAIVKTISCASCHGAGMKLWGAGRSPTYIFRQLMAFKTGARHDPESPPMRAVAARLTPADMIAVAAYWGSLTP